MRTKQLVKMKKFYGRWYNMTPYYVTNDEEKEFSKKQLGKVISLIRKSNRSHKDYGTNRIKYIPAKVRRKIAFYDKELLRFKGGYIEYRASFSNWQLYYTSAKTYTIMVCSGRPDEGDYIFRLKHNVQLFVLEY